MFIETKDGTLINLDHVVRIGKKRLTGRHEMYVIYAICTDDPRGTHVIADNCTAHQADNILADIKKHIANRDISLIPKYQLSKRRKPKQPTRDFVNRQDDPRHDPEPDAPKPPRSAGCSVQYKHLYNDEKALQDYNYVPNLKHANEHNTSAEKRLARNPERYMRLAEELNTSALIAAILDNLDFLFTEGDLYVTRILTILLKPFADVVKAEEAGLGGYGRDYVYKLKPDIERKLKG